MSSDLPDGPEDRQARPEEPPRTGVPQVDAAVADLAELRNLPLAEYHDRLAEAQAALAEALSGDGTAEDPGGRDDPARP